MVRLYDDQFTFVLSCFLKAIKHNERQTGSTATSLMIWTTGQKAVGSGGSAGSRQAGSTLCHLLARPPDGAGGALKRIPARPWGLSHFICEIFWRDDPKNGERAAGVRSGVQGFVFLKGMAPLPPSLDSIAGQLA